VCVGHATPARRYSYHEIRHAGTASTSAVQNVLGFRKAGTLPTSSTSMLTCADLRVGNTQMAIPATNPLPHPPPPSDTSAIYATIPILPSRTPIALKARPWEMLLSQTVSSAGTPDVPPVSALHHAGLDPHQLLALRPSLHMNQVPTSCGASRPN
jgi:hypothetical protein